MFTLFLLKASALQTTERTDSSYSLKDPKTQPASPRVSPSLTPQRDISLVENKIFPTLPETLPNTNSWIDIFKSLLYFPSTILEVVALLGVVDDEL